MRQLVAALLVAGSLAAPALRAACELACVPGTGQRAVSVPSCHETVSEPAAVSALSLAAPDGCGDHTPLPAVAASHKARAGFSQLTLRLSIESSLVAPIGRNSRVLSAHAPTDTSPPIPPGTRILRV